MTTGAADMMFRCVFNGSLSMCDMDIERRPYHRNCSCALHKLKGICPNAAPQFRTVSYPKKESWSNNSCSISASTISSQSSCISNAFIRSKEFVNDSSCQM